MRDKLLLGMLLLFLASSTALWAQMTSERLLEATKQAKDLEFPAEPSRLSVFSAPRMALYKPEGAGPFPAIVLHHQCGGLGAPVEWHVYPGTTHCWDCENLHNLSKVDVRGNQVVYRYDKAVTQDSARRMFDFLQKNMGAQ